tara:strand:+ start:331 stop:528 length:198 start_codon:yes stop_codon:yes gene_type:complete
MTTYSNTLKLDSLPSHEVMTGYFSVIKLDSLPLFEVTTGGYRPAIKVIYYEEDRPRSGQIYPRSL